MRQQFTQPVEFRSTDVAAFGAVDMRVDCDDLPLPELQFGCLGSLPVERRGHIVVPRQPYDRALIVRRNRVAYSRVGGLRGVVCDVAGHDHRVGRTLR